MVPSAYLQTALNTLIFQCLFVSPNLSSITLKSLRITYLDFKKLIKGRGSHS